VNLYLCFPCLSPWRVLVQLYVLPIPRDLDFEMSSFYIREIAVSNLVPDASYLNWGVCDFHSDVVENRAPPRSFSFCMHFKLVIHTSTFRRFKACDIEETSLNNMLSFQFTIYILLFSHVLLHFSWHGVIKKYTLYQHKDGSGFLYYAADMSAGCFCCG